MINAFNFKTAFANPRLAKLHEDQIAQSMVAMFGLNGRDPISKDEMTFHRTPPGAVVDVIEALKSGPMTANEISIRTGRSRDHVRKILVSLHKNGSTRYTYRDTKSRAVKVWELVDEAHDENH